MQLRQYQKRIINLIINNIKDGAKRQLVCSPTGS